MKRIKYRNSQGHNLVVRAVSQTFEGGNRIFKDYFLIKEIAVSSSENQWSNYLLLSYNIQNTSKIWQKRIFALTWIWDLLVLGRIDQASSGSSWWTPSRPSQSTPTWWPGTTHQDHKLAEDGEEEDKRWEREWMTETEERKEHSAIFVRRKVKLMLRHQHDK